MSDADDIAINLAQHFRKQKGHDRLAITLSLTTLVSIAGTGWWFRGIVEDLRSDIRAQALDIKYLREHTDSVEREAIAAKQSGDAAQAQLWALKGGYK